MEFSSMELGSYLYHPKSPRMAGQILAIECLNEPKVLLTLWGAHPYYPSTPKRAGIIPLFGCSLMLSFDLGEAI